MRGHEPLISMRLGGRVPAYGIEVSTDGDSNPLTSTWHKDLPFKAYVHIAPSEGLRSLDLRFSAVLPVTVDGMSSRRVREVFEAFTSAKASRVFGNVFIHRGDDFELIEVFDSKAGGVIWQK